MAYFGFILYFILIFAVFYLVVVTLKDIPTVGKIYDALHPIVDSMLTALQKGLAWCAEKLSSAKNNPPK